MLTKRERKIFDRIERKIRLELEDSFIELMMNSVPFEDDITIKIPCKKKMLKMMNDKLNGANSTILSGMIHKFVSEKYEVIQK